MAILKRKQIKELSNEDLRKRLNDLRLSLAKEKAQIAVGAAPSNTGNVGETRRTIARLLTEIKLRGKKEVMKTG